MFKTNGLFKRRILVERKRIGTLILWPLGIRKNPQSLKDVLFILIIIVILLVTYLVMMNKYS